MQRTRTVMIKESGSRKIELTVNPAQLSVTDPMNHNRETVDQLGEVLVPGKRGLKEVTISSFLPDSSSPFYNGETIRGDLRLIERWKENATKVRVIISNPKVNFRAVLSSDSLTLKEGQRDVYIDWQFTEYKDIAVPNVATVEGMINVTDPVPSLSERSEESAPSAGTTVTVKPDTTLWALAVKYYGDGAQWQKISEANGNVNPKKLQVGMELTIP